MFDFINRAASMSDPSIVDGLNALIKAMDGANNWSLRKGVKGGGWPMPERKSLSMRSPEPWHKLADMGLLQKRQFSGRWQIARSIHLFMRHVSHQESRCSEGFK